jgi:hypothetical protein
MGGAASDDDDDVIPYRTRIPCRRRAFPPSLFRRFKSAAARVDRDIALLIAPLKMPFFTAPLSEAEHALPPLPVPDIQPTLQKLITSCRPLATQQEMADLERDCELFARTHAPQLQAWLQELQRSNVNWLEAMWEQLAYLSWAEPLAVNSNYASPFPPITAATPPAARVSQTLAAARAILMCLEFFSLLDSGSLKPDVLAGRNVDWSQYERLFSTTRCALPDSDVMVHHDPRLQQHIVVCAKDRVFVLPVKGTHVTPSPHCIFVTTCPRKAAASWRSTSRCVTSCNSRATSRRACPTRSLSAPSPRCRGAL